MMRGVRIRASTAASLHRWDLEPREAVELQRRLCRRVVARRVFRRLSTVAGADIAIAGDHAVAAVIVYRFASPLVFLGKGQISGGGALTEVERATTLGRLRFPYVSGLLSFCEAPLLFQAFEKLSALPDVALLDGQGVAHPRRFGFASHMGLWLRIPTIGCAKSRLCGEHETPRAEAGGWVPLLDVPRGDLRTGRPREVIGADLTMRPRVRPVYVSVGHRIDLASAVATVLACSDGRRIPRPTREADRLAGELKRSIGNGSVDSSGKNC